MWLVKPYIPVGGSVVIVGKTKSGKSQLSLGMTLALTTGGRFLNSEPAPLGKVLYLQADNPRGMWIESFKILRNEGIRIPDDRLCICDSEDLPFPFNIRNPHHAEVIIEKVDAFQPDIVIIDTWRTTFAGDENSNSETQQALDSWRLACGHHAARIFIHHPKKDPPDGSEWDLLESVRGAGALAANIDTIIGLRAYAKKVDKLTGEELYPGKLRFFGRRSKGEIDLIQDQTTYLWHLAPEKKADPFKEALEAIIKDFSYTSDKDRAEVLAEQFNRSVGGVQSMISRMRK
jgi:RecA-family ATPase